MRRSGGAGLGSAPRGAEEERPTEPEPAEGPGPTVQRQPRLEPPALRRPGRPRGGAAQRATEALRGVRRPLGEDRPHLQVLRPGAGWLICDTCPRGHLHNSTVFVTEITFLYHTTQSSRVVQVAIANFCITKNR